MERLGIDVGGSGIKGALVDLGTGELVTERLRVDTPEGFELDAVVAVIAKIAAELDSDGPLGVGFPAVVRHGVVASPPTAHEFDGWIGVDLAAAIGTATGAPAEVLNDADAAGLAELSFGAARQRRGVVIVLTFGTGVGSGLFVDGRLVPNTELGKLYLENQPSVAENQVADRVRGEEELDWAEWGERLQAYLEHLDRLFTPDLVVVGGGVSKRFDRYRDAIDIRAEVVAAELRNAAGIVGAAAAVADR